MQANQPDFTVLISGSYDASIRCWDTRSKSQEPIQILNEAKDSISSLQISENAIISGLVYEFNSCEVDKYIVIHISNHTKGQECFPIKQYFSFSLTFSGGMQL